MKKLAAFFVFIFFITAHSGYGQGLHVDSTRFITGVNPYTEIRFSIPTSDKGILFVGSASYNAGGIIPYFPYGNANVLVGKIDSNQKISWVKQFGGSDDDIAFSACQTSGGGYAVLAHTSSNNGDITGYKGGSDIWLLRLDDSGNLLWEKTYGSSGDDQPISIALTPDNGFIVLGVSNGSDDDVPFHYGSMWSFDWLVIKTDSVGTVQWSKDLGGTGDEGGGTILSVDSFYYLAGISNSSDHDCTDTAWHTGVNTSFDYYLLRLNNSGSILWDSSYGGTGSEGLSYAMFDKRDSTIVMIGTTNSVDYMITGHHGLQDVWTVKLNKNGTMLWQRDIGSANNDVGASICETTSGGYMAYGSAQYAIGGLDGWIVALDNDGNKTDEKIFGGTDNEMPGSVVPYLNGFAASGFSLSTSFTEGTTYGRFSNGAFVSYIDCWPLEVSNLNSENKPMAVYPNPVHDNISIFFTDNSTGTLSVINGVGQTVATKELKVPARNLNIICGDWMSGLYLLRWQGEDGTVLTTKFIKN